MDANIEWIDHINSLVHQGYFAKPRNMTTRTLRNLQTYWDPREPIITDPTRDLRYRFMFAEAHWILCGGNRVDQIAPYNKNITQFSDDGETFFGAYGPKVVDQMEYIEDALLNDNETRQAVLTIWREKPPPTKDVPCTVAMNFYRIGDHELGCHVFMRSSDAWLGLPYDVFNFSMIMYYVASSLMWEPTELVITLVNAHLYERDWDGAERVVKTHQRRGCKTTRIVSKPWLWQNSDDLMEHLHRAKEQPSRHQAIHAWENM